MTKDPATAALDATTDNEDLDTIYNRRMPQSALLLLFTLTACLPVQYRLWTALFGKCRIKNSSAIFGKWLRNLLVVQAACFAWLIADIVYQESGTEWVVPEFPTYYVALMLVVLSIVCSMTQDPKTAAQHTGIAFFAALPSALLLTKVSFFDNLIHDKDINQPSIYLMTMIGVFWDDFVGAGRACRTRLQSRFGGSSSRKGNKIRGSDSRSSIRSSSSRTCVKSSGSRTAVRSSGSKTAMRRSASPGQVKGSNSRTAVCPKPSASRTKMCTSRESDIHSNPSDVCEQSVTSITSVDQGRRGTPPTTVHQTTYSKKKKTHSFALGVFKAGNPVLDVGKHLGNGYAKLGQEHTHGTPCFAFELWRWVRNIRSSSTGRSQCRRPSDDEGHD